MRNDQHPRLVDWALTSKCNLNCRHCRGMTRDDLSARRAREVVEEIARLEPGWVIVEGGEPLLREDLFDLLDLMRQRQLEVHLITNGMMLDHSKMDMLKRLGVRVMVSIDGATPETYESIREGASFERVIESAGTYAREGLLEAINFTVLKRNYPEIPDFFKLAEQIGVQKINFIGLKPCYNYTEELLAPEEYRKAIRLTCESAQKSGIEFFFDEPFFWALAADEGLSACLPAIGAGILAAGTTACVFGEYLFIEPNGEVRPCSFAPMVLGSLANRSLVDIWQEVLDSPFFQKMKDPGSRGGYCQTCSYLPGCRGCRSRTYTLTGDWFAADPCCPVKNKLAGKVDI